MTTLTTLESNDDDVLTSTGKQGTVNMYPLLGLLLAVLSGVISVGAAYVVYMLAFAK